MKKIALSLLLGTMIVLLPSIQRARGQASPPSGADLMAQMESAMQSEGSAHLTFGGNIAGPQLTSGSVSGQGDISSVDQRSHLVGALPVIVTANGSQTAEIVREETIRVGHHEANRIQYPDTQSGKDGQTLSDQPWQCSTVKHLLPDTYDVVGVPTDLKDVTNQGATTIQNVPVWLVTATSVDGATNAVQEHEYYIGQADSLLVRQTFVVTVNPGPNQTTTTLAIDYTQYGEDVHVSLPAACRHHTTDDSPPLQDGQLLPLDAL